MKTLDNVETELGIGAVDLVKVDLDGHEPFFLDGAQQYLTRYRPIIVMEFSQLNLDVSGLTVLDQSRQVEDLGYVLVSEKTGQPFGSRTEFLLECGNYAYTANVWAYPREKEAFYDSPNPIMSLVERANS